MPATVTAPIHADEPVRLERLRALSVLDTAPEALFDTLARAAAAACAMPVAFVTLIDADRQWAKAWVGVPGLEDVPRDAAICAHTLVEGDVLEIPDLRLDPRFADKLPDGGAHGVRFYAGAPIVLSDGLAMGALCVIDHRPRRLDAGQRDALRQLAQAVAQALEIRERAMHSIADAAADRQRLQQVYEITPAMLHCSDADLRLIAVSDTWLAKLGYRREEVLGRRSIDFLSAASLAEARQEWLPDLHRTGRCERVPMQMLRRDGSVLELQMSAITERDASGALARSMVVIEDMTERRAAERERIDSEARYRALVEEQSDLVSVSSREGVLTLVNSAYAAFFGKSTSALIGTSLYDQVPVEIRPQIAQLRARVFEEGGIVESESLMVSAAGEARWYTWTSRVLTDADGRATAIHAVGRDITLRKDIERRLAESRELLQVTLDSIGDAVITTDAQGLVQWLNPVGERLTGWHKAEAQGRPLAQVFHVVEEESRRTVTDPAALCLAQGQAVGRSNDTVLISRDGSEYGITDSASPIRDAQGALLGAVLVFHDATEQRRMSREMSHRARHDALTGLVNRTEFELRLTRLLARAQERGPAANGGGSGSGTGTGTGHDDSALLYLDLDQFKLVNDACGHSVGDQLLRQVSALLEASVRGRDTVARLGGDEFGILLEHCGIAHAQRVAQDICDRMEEFRFLHDGRRFRVGASIGLVPLDGGVATTPAAVMQAADTSCYAAKEAGRNRVHIWFDTDQAMRARQGEMQWANRIEQALDEDGFVLFAQRIVPTHGAGEGLHCELLLRMREAGGGLVPPGAFLPAAERFHLATRIDRWVTRHAFAWLADIGAEARHIELIAINVSGQSIGDGAFCRDIAEMLRAAPFDTRKLCFEITETAAITNFAEARSFVENMRALGVKIALDDFGAGASSFGYLKTLPVDFLKIDGQFITDLLEDPLDNAAVHCFRDVAKVIGVKTIAEFVERADVLDALRTIGIDYAQGYLVHRPEPLEALFAAMRAEA